jgi:hypothetical protein
MKLGNDFIYVDPGYSAELLDFFKACDRNDMGQLLKVSQIQVSNNLAKFAISTDFWELERLA